MNMWPKTTCLEQDFQMKAKQERTLTLCTKLDNWNDDGFLISGGCGSLKSGVLVIDWKPTHTEALKFCPMF